MGLGLDGILLRAPLLGEAVQQHTGDGHEGTHGRQGGELGLEDDDGGGDQEDALEGVTHGVGHGVHDAQAPEGHFVCKRVTLVTMMAVSFFGVLVNGRVAQVVSTSKARRASEARRAYSCLVCVSLNHRNYGKREDNKNGGTDWIGNCERPCMCPVS